MNYNEGVNLKETRKNKFLVELNEINVRLLSIDWVSQPKELEGLIKKAIKIRETLKSIDIDVIVYRLKHKIKNGGLIELVDLFEIERNGWDVPPEVWEIVKKRERIGDS